MKRLYKQSKRMLPPRSQTDKILPLAKVLELTTSNVPTVMSKTAFANKVLKRLGMDALENRTKAENRLMMPARMLRPPKPARAITKGDFLKTD
jgi:hypothetical protein